MSLEGFQRFQAYPTHLGNAVQITVHISRTQVLFDGKDDQMRGIENLCLIPTHRMQLGSHSRVCNNEELPRLQPVGRRRASERVCKLLPIVGTDRARWIELLRRIAPVQLSNDRVIVDRLHRQASFEIWYCVPNALILGSVSPGLQEPTSMLATYMS